MTARVHQLHLSRSLHRFAIQASSQRACTAPIQRPREPSRKSALQANKRLSLLSACFTARMASVARAAEIVISPPALMIAIRPGFRMLVTIDAFKRRIIRLVAMAITARRPHSRTVARTGGCGKIIVVRKKSRRLPCQCAMTHGAVTREFCSPVVWISRGVVFFLMAGGTFHGRSMVAVVFMASRTGDAVVRSPRWKLRSIMIKIFEPRLCVVRMTLHAVCAEPRLLMVDVPLGLIILPMALITLHRCAGKLQGCVACFAVDQFMASIQLESSC